MMRKITLAAIGLAATISQSANAEELAGVWFIGGSVSDSSSAYGGAVYSLPGARLGDGLALRATINGGEYRYESGDQTIDGKYAGGEVSLVLQTSGEWGWANFSFGPRLTDVSLTPNDISNKRRGTRFDVGIQGDGAFDWERYRASWAGSVGPIDETYQARLQFGRKLQDRRYEVGIATSLVGDPSFEQKSLGVYVALPLAGQIRAQIGSGMTIDDSSHRKIYGSIGLSSVF